MHEGFVRSLDTPEMRGLCLVGTVGRARGITASSDRPTVTTYYPSGVDGGYIVECRSLENTCACWPASGQRCAACKAM